MLSLSSMTLVTARDRPGCLRHSAQVSRTGQPRFPKGLWPECDGNPPGANRRRAFRPQRWVGVPSLRSGVRGAGGRLDFFARQQELRVLPEGMALRKLEERLELRLPGLVLAAVDQQRAEVE